ncbi:transglycosylase SLT domain-containing protein [Bradyrhizobium neotropicale]|uniref:transglycosylase SLT domain-containing protein n=1 Tax=Bradyrhizobium neotropicale TaxID=1497615 RepID=UPI001AD66806|nr:transglycosylase SLT domain-containing protein [Bradyrhizobium neotropicale]MBO4228002.1 transglycosylase SLT domain-containing protein [Bradyrhizobium neotropicale]
MATADDIIARESGGNPNATNPRSSAAGLGQFIDSTWLSMLRRHRPDIADGRADSDLLALKFDPTLSREMTAAYAADNNAVLTKAGLPVTPGTTYLAHFAGPAGAVKVLQADPATPVAQILDAKAVAANPHIRNFTAGDLRAWAEGKKPSGTPQVVTNLATPTPITSNLGDTFTKLGQSIQLPLTLPTIGIQSAPPSVDSGPSMDDPAFAPRTVAGQLARRRKVLG